MRFYVKARTIATLLALAVVPGLVGCTVVVRDRGGPPEHAPAYGHRYNDQYSYEYYYYPSAQVYFHVYSGHYYYRKGHRWIRTRVLPRHIHLHRGDRHRFRTRDRHPYIRHEEHRRQYRPRREIRRDGGYDREERELNRQRWHEYRNRREDRSSGREDRSSGREGGAITRLREEHETTSDSGQKSKGNLNGERIRAEKVKNKKKERRKEKGRDKDGNEDVQDKDQQKDRNSDERRNFRN